MKSVYCGVWHALCKLGSANAEPTFLPYQPDMLFWVSSWAQTTHCILPTRSYWLVSYPDQGLGMELIYWLLSEMFAYIVWSLLSKLTYLVPKPFPPPVFDRLQMQLRRGKTWKICPAISTCVPYQAWYSICEHYKNLCWLHGFCGYCMTGKFGGDSNWWIGLYNGVDWGYQIFNFPKWWTNVVCPYVSAIHVNCVHRVRWGCPCSVYMESCVRGH